MEYKLCTKCKENKPLTEFYSRGENKSKTRSHCKECLKLIALTHEIPETKICPKCMNLKSNLEFGRSKASYNGLVTYCKLCVNKLQRERRETPVGKEYNQKYNNSEKAKELRKIITERYREEGRTKEYKRKYAENNPEKIRERSIIRRQRKEQAKPLWYKIEREYIKFIFKTAKMLSNKLGKGFHVDHIVPLTSDIVCGLNCLSNLQILPAEINLKKSNRYWPDMPT